MDDAAGTFAVGLDFSHWRWNVCHRRAGYCKKIRADQDFQDERMNRIPRTATASKLLLSIFHLCPSASICGSFTPQAPTTASDHRTNPPNLQSRTSEPPHLACDHRARNNSTPSHASVPLPSSHLSHASNSASTPASISDPESLPLRLEYSLIAQRICNKKESIAMKVFDLIICHIYLSLPPLQRASRHYHPASYR